MKDILIHWLLIISAALSLSACSLPIPVKIVEGCVYEDEVSVGDICRAESVEKHLNELRCQVEDGHVYAAVCLGHMYLVGDGAPCDPACAFKWYKVAADAGISVAEVQVGHFYRDGSAPTGRDLNEAVAWYRSAADHGDIVGMLALGEMYKGWYGAKSDYQKAIYWYTSAANCGSVDAEYQLALLQTRGLTKCTVQEGLDRLNALSGDAHPDAIASVADIYYEGRVGPRDLKKAYECYCSSAKLGSAQAAFKLGMLYSMGEYVGQDHEKAAEWFIYAAERGMPDAQLYVGNLYREGRGVPKSYKIANVWYERAARNKVWLGHRELGDLYHAGKGVPRFLEEAVRHYTIAADHGKDPYAALMLSVLYEDGRGVTPDLKTSVCYYELAKSQPTFALAQYKIGRRFATGFGLPLNMDDAIRWYYRAAENGLTLAQVEIADLYYSGECLPQDFGKAYHWYHKAAVQGHSYAQNMLGLILLEGDCLPQYARTRVPGFKARGKINALDCAQCKQTICTCEPAYSERQGNGCALCLIRDSSRSLEVQCRCSPKTPCNCGARYAYRMPKWCKEVCGSKHHCGAVPGRCTVAISSHNARNAAHWIRRAAIQGAEQAQFQLGVLYTMGVGVPKDEAMAYAWLHTALECMEDTTPDVINCLIDKMSPEMRKRAVCLADKYKCKYRKLVNYPSRY